VSNDRRVASIEQSVRSRDKQGVTKCIQAESQTYVACCSLCIAVTTNVETTERAHTTDTVLPSSSTASILSIQVLTSLPYPYARFVFSCCIVVSVIFVLFLTLTLLVVSCLIVSYLFSQSGWSTLESSYPPCHRQFCSSES
jgi:hypothetical protein